MRRSLLLDYTVSTKRAYSVELVVNGIKITKVVIDSHYELKHAESIDDDVIIKPGEALRWKRISARKDRRIISIL